jgi:hypothetical protein
MFDFEDPWWLVSVILVVVLWIMGVVIPVRMVAPTINVAAGYAQLDDDSTEDVPSMPKPPSLVLPVLAFLAGLGLVALSVRKRIAEPEGGNRWTWMACAAGLAAFWGIVLVLITMKLR